MLCFETSLSRENFKRGLCLRKELGVEKVMIGMLYTKHTGGERKQKKEYGNKCEVCNDMNRCERRGIGK